MIDDLITRMQGRVFSIEEAELLHKLIDLRVNSREYSARGMSGEELLVRTLGAIQSGDIHFNMARMDGFCGQNESCLRVYYQRVRK